MRAGVEEEVGMVGMTPAVLRDPGGFQECWVLEAEEEEEEERSQGKRSTEGHPAVVTHVCLVPETGDAEGLQQVTATEQ